MKSPNGLAVSSIRIGDFVVVEMTQHGAAVTRAYTPKLTIRQRLILWAVKRWWG